MKIYLYNLIFVLLFDTSLARESEKIIELETHSTKILLIKNNEYEVELYGFSAKYHTSEDMIKCLEQTMNKKNNAVIKVTPYSLVIKGCRLKNE